MDFLKKLFSSGGKEKDPVCGMTVDPKTTKYHSVYNGNHYYFCSEHCKKQFDNLSCMFPAFIGVWSRRSNLFSMECFRMGRCIRIFCQNLIIINRHK